METTTRINHQSTMATQERYVTGSVIAKDGTVVDYCELGHGPGVVMVHGAMESARSHLRLAES